MTKTNQSTNLNTPSIFKNNVCPRVQSLLYLYAFNVAFVVNEHFFNIFKYRRCLLHNLVVSFDTLARNAPSSCNNYTLYRTLDRFSLNENCHKTHIYPTCTLFFVGALSPGCCYNELDQPNYLNCSAPLCSSL